MFLRPPSWAGDPLRASASSSSSSSSSAQSPMVDFVLSLTNQRLYREVMLALRTGLRNSKAEFSFMRVRGLRSLTKFLSEAVKSEKIMELFLETQVYVELQVVPVLFEHMLAPLKREAKDPIVVTSPSRVEIGLALRLLEGCCLLDSGSRLLASRYFAAKVLLALLLNSEPPEQCACLDALLAVMLYSTSNQKEFERGQGVRKIAELVKSESLEESIRGKKPGGGREHHPKTLLEKMKNYQTPAVIWLKCAEFLLLLVGRVLPAHARPANGFQHGDGRKGVVTFEGARQDVVEVLGPRWGVVLDAMISNQPSMFDFDTEQTSTRTLAERLLELS